MWSVAHLPNDFVANVVRCCLWVRTCCPSTSFTCRVITAGRYFTTRRSKPSGTGSFSSLSSTPPSARPTSPRSSSREAATRTVGNPASPSTRTGMGNRDVYRAGIYWHWRCILAVVSAADNVRQFVRLKFHGSSFLIASLSPGASIIGGLGEQSPTFLKVGGSTDWACQLICCAWIIR